MKYFIKRYILIPFYRIVLGFRYFFIPSSPEELKTNRPCPLKIKTPEKSGQGVHPSLLYLPQENPPFILAFTPYPFSIDSFENPSILISADGLRFFEEIPCLNPLASPPPLDHNDDPDLFLYENRYTIVYLETLRPEKQNILLLSSGDRKTWSSRLIHTDYFTGKAPDPFILSPSFVRHKKNDYLFYVIMNASGSNEIHYVSVGSGFKPDFTERKKATFDLYGHNPWHISIISGEDTYYMLVCCTEKTGRYDLYIARSNNAVEWEFSKKILMKNAYRSSGFIKNNTLFLYYSQKKKSGAWELGINKKNIDSFFEEKFSKTKFQDNSSPL